MKCTPDAKAARSAPDYGLQQLRVMAACVGRIGRVLVRTVTCDMARAARLQVFPAQFISHPPPPVMQQFDCPQPAPAVEEPFGLLTANTESCCSSLVVWHLGHSALCSPSRMASNL